MRFAVKISFILIIILIQITSCKPKELKITSIELCEFFGSDGVCREKLGKVHTYHILVERPKKFETWEELGNYLYFKSRQTPGFIVRFNREFTQMEKDLIRNSYKASYEFKGSLGNVEGFEVGSDWIGSFQYLGSILKNRQRQIKQEKVIPNLNFVFPAPIHFSFESDIAHGTIATEVNLDLKYDY